MSLHGVESRFQFSSDVKLIESKMLMPLRSNGYCFHSLYERFAVVDKEVQGCYLGEIDGRSSTLLFGDSYAGHNEPFFDLVFKANKVSLQSITTNWCTPSLTGRFIGTKTHTSYEQCMLNRKYLKENILQYKNIILGGCWGCEINKGRIEEVESLVEYAANLGVNVFIIAAPYKFKENPLPKFYKALYGGLHFQTNKILGDDSMMSKGNKRLNNYSNRFSNVHFIDRTLLYSQDNSFNMNGIQVPYSLDGGHISILGAQESAKYFMSKKEYIELMRKFQFD
jgi:hypothetical protein